MYHLRQLLLYVASELLVGLGFAWSCLCYTQQSLCLHFTEIEANKKQAEAHHKEIDDLKRERDALNKVQFYVWWVWNVLHDLQCSMFIYVCLHMSMHMSAYVSCLSDYTYSIIGT